MAKLQLKSDNINPFDADIYRFSCRTGTAVIILWAEAKIQTMMRNVRKIFRKFAENWDTFIQTNEQHQ